MEASDGNDGTATATVEISVTDVAEDAPPAPEGLSVSLADGEFSITWDELTGAARYEAQYRISGSGDDWPGIETTEGTSSTFSPRDGPACGSTYGFRVRAYGDGTTYAAEWGLPSDIASVTTDACNQAPEFDVALYDFSVSEDASIGDPVGTVSATDPDEGDTVSYLITAGNGNGKFAIDDSMGEVAVVGSLDHEATPSYTLTVEASDGRGGTDTATVEVTVTDVAEDRPPAPENLSVSLAEGAFTITWSSVTGAARYEVQHRIGGSDDGWVSLPATDGTSATYSPEGGPACGTTYEFRARAYGDGTVYVAGWGTESGPVSVATSACNGAPEFGQSAYSFTVAENAATSSLVGTVSATDPDDDPLTYLITDGNSDGKFSLGDRTGKITVSGALDHETESSYTLTVEASDGRGGTATTTVEITVTDVAEDAPPTPSGLSVSLVDGVFTISWGALPGAARYEAQHRVEGSGDDWAVAGQPRPHPSHTRLKTILPAEPPTSSGCGRSGTGRCTSPHGALSPTLSPSPRASATEHPGSGRHFTRSP